eukprot:951825-Alexandrium_andersonii.AAC.1
MAPRLRCCSCGQRMKQALRLSQTRLLTAGRFPIPLPLRGDADHEGPRIRLRLVVLHGHHAR